MQIPCIIYGLSCMYRLFRTAVGIDHIPELADMARENIEKDQPELLKSGRVKLIVGDGRLGVPELGPYNAIHVGAAALEVPQALVDQLKVSTNLIFVPR